MDSTAAVSRWTARYGAFLLLGGFLTGRLVSAARDGSIGADPNTILSAHVTALLGAVWAFSVAWSLPMLRLGLAGQRWLVRGVLLSGYAGWLVTTFKAFWHVAGIEVTSDSRNNIIFGVLLATVVFPALAATVTWIYGLRGSPP